MKNNQLEAKNIEKGTPKIYRQSANVFFHCMKKLAHLKQIFERKAILPRYNVEIIDFLNIPDCREIAFPMICFCDIFLKLLSPHMKNYGDYVIGLDKDFGIQNGFEPIQYINNKSEVAKKLQSVMNYLSANADEESAGEAIYSDQIISSLLYIKPLYGLMRLGDNISDNRLFTDEREWRFIPDMTDSELDKLMPAKKLVQANLNLYSEAMTKYEKGWLKIDLDAVKYIIVKNDDEIDDMISFIKTLDNWKDHEKDRLLTKLLTFDELKKDM